MSTRGASNALLLLAERLQVSLLISHQVIEETERALAKKQPRTLPIYRDLVRRARIEVVSTPASPALAAYRAMIAHEPDQSILAAAVLARVDYLVTLNRRHFIDDPRVAERSGLRIGSPGDALAWVRERARTAESG